MKMSEVTTVICIVCTSVVNVFESIFCNGKVSPGCEMPRSTSVCHRICTSSSRGASLAN
jgi:hypothetical protein